MNAAKPASRAFGAARILRIELRRSVALWAALLIAAVGVFVLFASNEPYPSWMELVVTQRDIMQLTWPLALGAGAWQGIRERRSRVEELVATTARPRRWRVVPVASAMAMGAVAGHLVMLAGAAGHLRHLDGYFALASVADHRARRRRSWWPRYGSVWPLGRRCPRR